MILVLHIIVALASLVTATLAFTKRSQRMIWATYGLTVSTLATGFTVVATRQVHLLQVCATGLLYVGVVFLVLAGAHYRLARAAQSTRR